MISVRKSQERGHARHGWLDTYHTFSFADYYDPRFTGFRDLLVINEDTVQPGEGFPTHGHRDMEILTYVVSGALAHKDSMGNGSVIRPGEIQRMSAGAGVRHSEFNASDADLLHLLQIWITPEKEGIPAGYEQKKIERDPGKQSLSLIASPTGERGSVTIHQNARIFSGVLKPAAEVVHPIEAGRAAWVQVIKGELSVNGTALKAGDGAAIEGEKQLQLAPRTETEFLLFDLP